MKTHQQLVAELKALNERIDEARNTESAAALLQVRNLVETFGFTAAQVFPLPGVGRPKLKPKFKDPVSGALWSGVGKPPKWIAGKDRTAFAIVEDTPAYTPSEHDDPNNPFPVQ